MFSYSFFVNEDRFNNLTLRILYKRQKAEIQVGVMIPPKDFANAMSIRPKADNLKWRNLVKRFQTVIDDIKCEMLENGDFDLDVKEIREIILRRCFGKTDDTPKGNFVPHFLEFIDSRVSEGTKENYRHTLNRIRLFDKDIADKSFEDIDFKWLTQFEQFCAQTACKNARNIHFRNIRAVFNNAINFEITAAYPFRRFRIRSEPTRKRAMTVDELRMLCAYPVENYLVFYRDIFKLIFCLIGINTADLHGLKEITKDGRIEYKRAKTGRLYSIKVEPEAMEIIKKYKGKTGLLEITDRWHKSRDFCRYINKHLKCIGELERRGRGGKKYITPLFPELTTYWARHTWATIAADLDIPDAVISQALGHSSDTISTTAIYIKRNEKKVDEANRRVLDWVFHGKRKQTEW